MDLSLNKLPWHVQFGLFAVLAIAAVAVFYYFYAIPAQESLAQRKAQLDALQVDINKGNATARQLPAFRGQVADLERRLESLRAVLPEEKDVADLLRRIQTMATQSNLTIRGFKPSPIATKQLHAEWPIRLELDGTYHNLGMFFDRISKFSRIINVSGIAIRAKDRPEPNSTVSAECVATTFVLLETPKSAPAVPGARPPGGVAR